MISPNDWANMNESERLSALNAMEQLEADNQDREPAKIISQKMPLYQGGSYDYDTNTIKINIDSLSNEEPYHALGTYYHESRHAYQHEQANNTAKADNPKQAQEWKENLKKENYITYEQDPEGYYNQPVEIDAKDYAQTRMLQYNEEQGLSTYPSSTETSSTTATEKIGELASGAIEDAYDYYSGIF